jgi:outer membrane protein TolC
MAAARRGRRRPGGAAVRQRPPRGSRRAACVAALWALLPAGCAVGPDFKRPAPPAVADYTPTPVGATVASAAAGGAAQRFVRGGELAGDWWTLFHSRALNDLIDAALGKNPDLKAARAALAARWTRRRRA